MVFSNWSLWRGGGGTRASQGVERKLSPLDPSSFWGQHPTFLNLIEQRPIADLQKLCSLHSVPMRVLQGGLDGWAFGFTCSPPCHLLQSE